ncbi:MAG: hypothetical protein OEY14_04715 [Myxococcales bacterium]|nr:hypothetical protein [Myxococcales bacterium]
MSFAPPPPKGPSEFQVPPEQRFELTNFDKLGASIAVFGGLILSALHVVLVPAARDLYSPMEGFGPGLTRLVFSRFYVVASVLLLLACAFGGAELRKRRDSRWASFAFFVGIALAVLLNGLLIYGMYAPATGFMDLRPED